MKCANCGHDEHIIVILNGTKMTKCIKCQVYQEAKEEQKNRSDKYGGTTIISGWKKRDHGTGLR
jgi:hypothetical protein